MAVHPAGHPRRSGGHCPHSGDDGRKVPSAVHSLGVPHAQTLGLPSLQPVRRDPEHGQQV